MNEHERQNYIPCEDALEQRETLTKKENLAYLWHTESCPDDLEEPEYKK